jgi:Domain of unknown function (DUF6434)
MANFDWHSEKITPETPITASYRNTQNVRRFFKIECRSHFKFDHPCTPHLNSRSKAQSRYKRTGARPAKQSEAGWER